MIALSPKKILFMLLLALTSVGLSAEQARASHLRGVTLSWAPTGTPREVEFTFINSERHSAFFYTLNQSISRPITFGDGTSGNAVGPVTSINTTDDFYVAILKVKHIYDPAKGPGPFIAFHTASARIGGLGNAGSTLRLETAVTPSSNNTTPVAALPAVVTMPLVSPATFTVIASDADGDTLRFRLATIAEMGGGAHPAGLSINPNTGVVTWNLSALSPAPVPNKLYFTQIMVEDYDSANNLKSKVPVDVILKLVAAVGSPPSLTISPGGPLTVSPNAPVTFTVTGTDPDANSRVTLNGAGLPSGATMSPALGATLAPPVTSTFSWTPTLAQAGATGQSYVINFSATDDTNQQALRSITINVLPAGAPTAAGQNLTAASGVPLPVVLSATDPNGSNLTFSITAAPSQGIISNLGAPVCTFGGVGGVSTCTQSLTYTANSLYTGPDTFTFRVNNGVQNSNAGVISINVLSSNRTPVATGTTVTTNEDTPASVVPSASDPDGNPLSYTVLNGPAKGVLSGTAPNLTYTPNPNFYGPDSLTFKVSDGSLDSNVATVSITVTPVNDAPVAANDSYSVIGDLPLSVAAPGVVLTNDADIDSASITAVLNSTTTHGTLALSANGSFTYTPNAGYTGGDSFTYHANDGSANSNVATVSITVTAPTCISPQSGLVAWYPGQGNANDIVGNVTGTPTGSVPFSAGQVGQGFNFNGSGYFSIPSANVPVGNAPRTVQFWVSPRATAPDHEIFVYGTGAFNQAFGIDVDGTTASGNVRLQFYTYGNDINGLDTGVKPDQFMHVAVTYDGVALKAYINGVLKSTLTVSAPLNTTPSVVTIGHFFGNFDGKLDEVQIYNRALSGSEVQSLYTTSSAGTCQPPATTTTVSNLSTPFSPSPQSLTLNASVTSSIPVNSGNVQFTVKTGGGATVGSPVTSPVSGGAASATFTLPGGTPVQTLNVTASYTTSALDFQSSPGTGTLTITKATPTISWANPTDITYGTPLGSAQLNATPSVPGTLTYTPPAGTVLVAGNAQPLPVDAAATGNYNAASKTVHLDVQKATPVINWATPAPITYGVALSATQLNAAAAHPTVAGSLSGTAVAGVFAYTPAAGAVLPVGNNPLSVTFTPTDTANYTTAAKSVTQRVNYGVCAQYDQAKAHKSGSTIPIKLQLCDAAGVNLSSQSIVVTSIGVRMISVNAWGDSEDAGNANPDFNFRYTGGMYMYNLQTKGLATGTYQLGYVVGSDPTVYTVQFQIR